MSVGALIMCEDELENWTVQLEVVLYSGKTT